MEFPGLGKHCNESSCHQLDFLPVKCDVCNKIFCSEHYKYESHNCPTAYQKDVQVPVCPLCSTPIPGKSDELPDIRVSRHIDSDCQSDRAKDRRKNIYTNRCSSKGCKTKELIPIVCGRCGQNYCLKHRHEQDHACVASDSKPLNKAALAALSRSRSQSTGPNSQKPRSLSGSIPQGIATYGVRTSYSESRIQGNLTEDAALALALQASLGSPSQPGDNHLSQEQEDFLLAQAIAASEQESRRNSRPGGPTSRTGNPQKNNCSLS